MAYWNFKIIALFMLVNVYTLTFSTQLHLVPGKKMTSPRKHQFTIAFRGKKKGTVSNAYEENPQKNVAVKGITESSAVPYDKTKSEEESQSFILDFGSAKTDDKEEQLESKSDRIARLEKLAKENLEEIGRLKTDVLKDNHIQNTRGGNMENHLERANTSAVTAMVVNAATLNHTNQKTDLVAPAVQDEKKINLKTIGTAPNPAPYGNDKSGKIIKYGEKEDLLTAVEGKFDKNLDHANVEAKGGEVCTDNGKAEAKVDEKPNIEVKKDPCVEKLKNLKFDDANKIFDATLIETELVKLKHMKSIPKKKKKKVKIIILDEEEVPSRNTNASLYDSEDNPPTYESFPFPHIPDIPRYDHTSGYTFPCASLLAGAEIINNDMETHISNNCDPAGLPPPSFLGNHKQLPIHSAYATSPGLVQPLIHHKELPKGNTYLSLLGPVQPLHICCPPGLMSLHSKQNTYFPEYLESDLRHKIRHTHGNNIKRTEDALQPQFHYNFNFRKENTRHNIGNEESLSTSSLLTTWLDRKHLKTPENNSPLINKFTKFIVSPGNYIPGRNFKRVAGTLADMKYRNVDAALSNLHSTYKRSKTIGKKKTATLQTTTK